MKCRIKKRRKNVRKNKKLFPLLSGVILLFLVEGFLAAGEYNIWDEFIFSRKTSDKTEMSLPVYDGRPYMDINDNRPFFDEGDISEGTQKGFESYSSLDALGRCGVAYANLSKETMPKEERGKIGMIKPSGWINKKYPEVIDDLYLYNRCHLIAWCLSGENDNEKNLITGTRYMNVEGMLPFEERVADYIDKTGNHVLYRVTPVFEGKNLVAHGVLIEAYSIEDRGEGISFCVYCFNVQPGIDINYETGESRMFP